MLKLLYTGEPYPLQPLYSSPSSSRRDRELLMEAPPTKFITLLNYAKCSVLLRIDLCPSIIYTFFQLRFLNDSIFFAA